MGEELLDDLSLLIFKNQLLCGSIEELKKFYTDEKCYLSFLDTIALVSQREPAFFLLSTELKNRILQIVDIYRFSGKKEISDYVNEIVVYLNSIYNIPKEMSDLMIQSYIQFHEELRDTKFDNISDFLMALSYDAVLISALDDNNMDLLKGYDLNMSSFNYLMSTCPEFFDNKDIRNRVMNILNNEDVNSKPFSKKKKYIKAMKKRFNDIAKKEE